MSIGDDFADRDDRWMAEEEYYDAKTSSQTPSRDFPEAMKRPVQRRTIDGSPVPGSDAKASDEPTRRWHRTCWCPGCDRRAVFRDWGGWWWCVRHIRSHAMRPLHWAIFTPGRKK